MTAQFSETVTGFTSSDVLVSNGSISNFTAVDGDTYTFTITALSQGSVTVNVPAGGAVDAATKQNAASTRSLDLRHPADGRPQQRRHRLDEHRCVLVTASSASP